MRPSYLYNETPYNWKECFYIEYRVHQGTGSFQLSVGSLFSKVTDRLPCLCAAPPESGPPSYHGSSGAPSGLAGSEPPSYPPSSGPSSSHLELPGTSQKRLSVPTLASTLGSRSDVRGPPTYDEAMKDPCEEETEVHSPNDMVS